jgi:hypothetical protein
MVATIRQIHFEPVAHVLFPSGDILHGRFFNTHLVVLNSPKTAIALFQKRADKYSARFLFFFVGELVGWRDIIVACSDMKMVKDARNLLLADVGTGSSLNKIAPLLEQETKTFVQRIIEAPSSSMLPKHIRLWASKILHLCHYNIH